MHNTHWVLIVVIDALTWNAKAVDINAISREEKCCRQRQKYRSCAGNMRPAQVAEKKMHLAATRQEFLAWR